MQLLAAIAKLQKRLVKFLFIGNFFAKAIFFKKQRLPFLEAFEIQRYYL